jgi:hypothetical protein
MRNADSLDWRVVLVILGLDMCFCGEIAESRFVFLADW